VYSVTACSHRTFSRIRLLALSRLDAHRSVHFPVKARSASCRRLLPAYPFGPVLEATAMWMTRDSVNGITLSKTRITRPDVAHAWLSTFRGNRFVAQVREQVYNWSNRRESPATAHDDGPRSMVRVDAFFSESNSSRQSSQSPITPTDNAVGGKMWKDSGSLRGSASRGTSCRFIVVVRFCCC